eukprot:GHVN01020044.1.p1 GENE.GHVN01020044.1~~GHVN01020044.1.p1  ORF type:complete len:424 (-),score=39.81 GHVN01020044.1:3453-4724(-)
MSLQKSIPNHPNIVKFVGYQIQTHSSGKSREVQILTEYCDGGHLLDLLDRHEGQIPENVIVNVFKDACEAVLHLHSQEPPISHRDIKVENILCSRNRYKLCDFGSASSKSFDTKRCSRDEILGLEDQIQGTTTMMYRPPEMVDLYNGFEISGKVDIWMLGCVLFTMAFYRHPFQDESSLAIANANYRIPADVSKRFSSKLLDIIHWTLSKDPDERPSAQELVDVLRNYSSISEVPLPESVVRRRDSYEEKQRAELDMISRPLADVSLAGRIGNAKTPDCVKNDQKARSSKTERRKTPKGEKQKSKRKEEGAVSGPLFDTLPAESQFTDDPFATFVPSCPRVEGCTQASVPNQQASSDIILNNEWASFLLNDEKGNGELQQSTEGGWDQIAIKNIDVSSETQLPDGWPTTPREEKVTDKEFELC